LGVKIVKSSEGESKLEAEVKLNSLSIQGGERWRNKGVEDGVRD
jgi:hypothetical protein